MVRGSKSASGIRKSKTVQSGTNVLLPVLGPEIVVGLIGAIGTDLPAISDELCSNLKRVSYAGVEISVSKLMHGIKSYQRLALVKFQEERITRHMNAGNSLRKKIGGDALALLSVPAIRNIRRQNTGDQNEPSARTAYILRSLKNPEEIRTLRKVYGPNFIAVSVYAPRIARCDALAAAIADSHHESNSNKFRNQAEHLIARDEAESFDLGQNVRDTFPLADVIIDTTNRENAKKEIGRFIELLFSHPFHTPTRNEYGMYFARAAALRSSDLSRQVGAVIMTPAGEIIAAGCNEVPKAGGDNIGLAIRMICATTCWAMIPAPRSEKGSLENFSFVFQKIPGSAQNWLRLTSTNSCTVAFMAKTRRLSTARS